MTESFVLGTPAEREFHNPDLEPYLRKAKELPGTSVLVPHYEIWLNTAGQEPMKVPLEDIARMLNNASADYGFWFSSHFNHITNTNELHVVYSTRYADAGGTLLPAPWEQGETDGD